jgi:alcohol dehydrogenase
LFIEILAIATRVIDATTTPTLLKLVEAGKLKSGSLATHTFDFKDVYKAYETFGAAAEHNALKIIIKF